MYVIDEEFKKNLNIVEKGRSILLLGRIMPIDDK